MLKITLDEFKNNFDDYSQLGEKEEITITNDGKEVFVIIPYKIKRERDMESVFGLLPENATIGVDSDERG